ncbi:hypothetical protein [Embleya sp. NPDC050493]
MGDHSGGPAPIGPQNPDPRPKPGGPNDHPDGSTPAGPGTHRKDGK